MRDEGLGQGTGTRDWDEGLEVFPTHKLTFILLLEQICAPCWTPSALSPISNT